MADEKVRHHYEAEGSGAVSCSDLLGRLHKKFDALSAAFPEEFKDMAPVRSAGGRHSPTFDNSDDDDSDNKVDGEGDDDGGNAAVVLAVSDQALLLMQDESIGWKLIAQLQWRQTGDGVISKMDVRRRLADAGAWGKALFPKGGPIAGAAMVRALSFWLEQFAGRARQECKGLEKRDKNCVFQLVALGAVQRELFDAALRTPELLEFALHEIQDIDLPREIAAA